MCLQSLSNAFRSVSTLSFVSLFSLCVVSLRLRQMLATLLIIRQFLQNVKEVLQPYLYERHKLGELTLRAVWDLLLSVLLKYARLAAGKAQASPTDQTVPGPGLRGSRLGAALADQRSRII